MSKALVPVLLVPYVSERPEAMTAESANTKFKMIQPQNPGFKTGEEDTCAIGLRGPALRISQINASIKPSGWMYLMDRMIKEQPIGVYNGEESEPLLKSR